MCVFFYTYICISSHPSFVIVVIIIIVIIIIIILISFHFIHHRCGHHFVSIINVDRLMVHRVCDLQ